ncbi:proprotein convertase subtilisin/kexin type 7 [Callorhinchus milii]|uniref:proprotein convertase subtilisin/kexin type 7 n=1 Tax=Callorhinchus milii TaxID=7868 RepID=UPI0004571D4E|nr:proprotein convertase subtilisin/kexin type 7 [Callorhinchus milii]|eukprot:gi/632977693/ref/XP_007905489.1/ PREDICTED: proprotein convertase subtilisin/kexin type 7 [Callorhinchus milii]
MKKPRWRGLEAVLPAWLCLSVFVLWLPIAPSNGDPHPAVTSGLSPESEGEVGPRPGTEADGGTLTWAVHLTLSDRPGDREALDRLADKVARAARLDNHGQIGELAGHYLFALPLPHHPLPRPPRDLGGGEADSVRSSIESSLTEHEGVRWHSEQKLLKRSKRGLQFSDPKYPLQWHLHNRKRVGMDINVTGVWERNVTGRNVTVVVVDDGVEHTVPDIQENYAPEGSYDLNSNDPDPMPHPDEHGDNHHGTRCAGEIAAAPNHFCAVGVAYGCRIAGIRVLDGPLTDSMEAIAFNKHYQINDIYSCSWGPDDDGKTVDGPHPLGKVALQHGVMAGRRGFGSIFVVASGNGGQYEDNCNYDGYANSIYTVTIGAVDEEGRMPFYAEECASMLAVTFSSGDKMMRSIVTSDWDMREGTGCTEGHTGTSAAAPLAAGMVALMLQVRPCLTWRDVQHIIVFTSTRFDDRIAGWQINGAGLSHSHKHGFGLLNAWRLVNAAKIWESVPYLTSYSSPVQKEGKDIPLHPKVLEVVWNVTAEDLNLSGMKTLEHVAVTLTITHPARGKLEIKLFCPSGMSSLIGAKRVVDTDASGFNDWMFSTVRCWGERAEGIYKLTVHDSGKDSQQKRGSLKKSQLVLYGSSWSFEDVQQRRRLVEGAMSGQFLNDSFSLPCPLGLEISDQESTVMAPNTLKMLLLLGCFAVFWSIYYTLEVIYTRKTFEFSMWCNRYPCEQYSSLHSEELNKCTSELQPLQAPTSGQDPGDQWPLTVDGDHRVGDHRPLRCPATTGTDSVHLTSRQPAERVGPTQTPGVTGNIPRGTLLFALEDETT